MRNTGRFAAHLIAHTVNVNDANGHTSKAKGLGVFGQQPLPQLGQTVVADSGTQSGPDMAGQPDAPGIALEQALCGIAAMDLSDSLPGDLSQFLESSCQREITFLSGVGWCP
ncbi:MAG: ApaG domain [Comamonadaceae bacterium]|nr:ApaG domain [Comamonadaceae bacterium]